MPRSRTTKEDYIDQHVLLPPGIIAAGLVNGSRLMPPLSFPDYIRYLLGKATGYDPDHEMDYIKELLETDIVSGTMRERFEKLLEKYEKDG